ncbi:transglycosylase SLT domain-containing protein [Gammaproteobacteria bacterium]|nr:transglycosylase SLT domain-containing protein [Gammaproteobacteria bacterium]
MIFAILSLLSGCVVEEPQAGYEKDICQFVHAHSRWSSVLRKTEQEFEISPGLVMSVIYHESSFRSHVRPPRDIVLGVFPVRLRTEYGYGQIKDMTWQWYLEKDPGLFRSRTSFADTARFIGWYYKHYLAVSRPTKKRAYDFYLAYHEGLGGYQRLTQINDWLDRKSNSVQKYADQFDLVLRDCL